MKKIVLTASIIIASSLIYYFTFGSQQITQELKKQVNLQLELLEDNGFAIEERKIEDDSEHFIIHYKNPKKIQHYLKEQNIELQANDSQLLKGFKLAADISYMQGFYSAISMDLYPTALPLMIVEESTHNHQKEIEKILKEKLFLIHFDINKLFTSFKGYLKDIDTTFNSIQIVSKDFKFDGDYNGKQLTASTSSIQKFSLNTPNDFIITLKNLQGSYKQKGNSNYSFDSTQYIDEITLLLANQTKIELKKIDIQNRSNSKDNFLNTELISKIAELTVNGPNNQHHIKSLSSKLSLEQLSISALERLQSLNLNNPKESQEINQAIEEIIIQGAIFKLEYLNAQKILDNSTKQMVDGFDTHAKISLNRRVNLQKIINNPLALLQALESDAHISLSDALYNIVRKRAELSMILLFIKPISKDSKKIFDISYKENKLKINGKRLF